MKTIKPSNLGMKRACLSRSTALPRNIQVEAGKYWEIINDYIPGHMWQQINYYELCEGIAHSALNGSLEKAFSTFMLQSTQEIIRIH